MGLVWTLLGTRKKVGTRWLRLDWPPHPTMSFGHKENLLSENWLLGQEAGCGLGPKL